MSNSITQELIDQGESSSMEFIASPSSEEQIAKAVVAFLNTKGGTVIVGLDDHGRCPASLTKQHAQKLETFLRKQITPGTLFALSLDETLSGTVIVIEVPKGRDRPFMFKGAVFVRSGGSNKAANRDDIRKMVFQDTDQPRWERQIATGLGVEDLDAKLIRQTVSSARESRGMSLADSTDTLSVLAEFSMTQFGSLTNAADVSFGKRVSSRQPQTRVRAVCYETDRGGSHFLDDQLFEGPAISIYENAMAFLQRHVSVVNQFRPGEGQRRSQPEYPFDSLREALINALAHRDYSAYSGGASISIYPDRIEIWNTGKLAVSASKLAKAQHESILTNPDISHVLYLNGLMERIGRGTYKIVQECEQFGMRPPNWKQLDSGVRLTLFSASRAVGADELSHRHLEVVRSMKTGDSISLSEYVERFSAEDLSDRQARRDLKELTESGLLERQGAARATRYVRTAMVLD